MNAYANDGDRPDAAPTDNAEAAAVAGVVVVVAVVLLSCEQLQHSRCN